MVPQMLYVRDGLRFSTSAGTPVGTSSSSTSELQLAARIAGSPSGLSGRPFGDMAFGVAAEIPERRRSAGLAPRSPLPQTQAILFL
mmetsp:Transcript_67323/g.93083  ORF Transcript_67323/g.93083 Transcript_67323/m.93083 type:complete len:86 (+) Transcript_67323:83-340(+)